jgi:NADPH:quinone reductase-like Zn-dependent oxidoreductase
MGKKKLIFQFSAPIRDRCIRSTGNSRFWRRLLVKRHLNDQSNLLPKKSHEGEDRDIADDSDDGQYFSDGEEEGDVNHVIFSSNNYHLVKENKNISYDQSSHRNPKRDLIVLDYDVFPVFVEKDRCLIKIEASSIDYLDCVIRKEKWIGNSSGFRDIPGMNIVGTVMIAGDDAIFREGDRVATVVQTGGNARFTVCSSKILLRLSKTDDAHQICAILSAYLPAFSLIQHGVKDSTERYRLNPLFGLNVFINGGMSSHGQAIIDLANLFGAQNIYASGRQKDHHHLKKMGAIPVSMNSKSAFEKLSGKIDLVFDTTSFDMLEQLIQMRVGGGRVIFDQYGDVCENGVHGFRSKMDWVPLVGKSHIAGNCFVSDYLLNFYNHFDVFKNDFNHIKDMMHRNEASKLEPVIAATCKLEEIPDIHLQLEKTFAHGTFVCDPWA